MEKDKGSDFRVSTVEPKSRIVGLILAAGYSSRMGAFKPLLPIGDITALERVSAALKGAGIKNIIGVTGYRRELLAPVLESEGIVEAYNTDFERGMFTSIQTGIRKAAGIDAGSSAAPGAVPAGTPEGYFLMLVDCPLIPAEVLDRILEKHREAPEAFIVPCYRKKKGHPLFIPGHYTQEILAYQGEGGLKAITKRHEDRLIRLDVDTEAVVLDMDTPEGYQEILEFYEQRCDWKEELKDKRLFLIRHGEIRQHKEKIFLGQTDVPLSEKGREQAKNTAEELRRDGVSVSRIYSSDLNRARETAEVIIEDLTLGCGNPEIVREITIIPEPKFREMSLGEWDGRYISEIRDQYPEEYQKRGENLLSYKFGNDSENFYDLQYRALKGLKCVLKAEREAGDGSGDIVIVSHSGVINVILSELLNRELSEQINNQIPNGGVVIIAGQR